MRDPIQWIALIGMVGIAALFMVEVRKWCAIASIMGRSQRILRGLMFLAIEMLFVMMLIGPWITGRKDPITSLLYWTVCLVVALVVIVLVLLDCRTVVRQYAQMNRQIFRELKDSDGTHGRMDRPEDNGRET